ncbi:hypothetical protein EPUS_06973 [Endocarpon pusillum Z07020]|uniref:Peroxidase n=1 Tax=Endocarpon pusillum (strain Z07020 / HMAS-L-300199) TaxID=1263415 RepID=U1HZQ9_ENDPU|nr:uncharacterized protein EPUS_06973 [Endocarpon pusillum Z07020]ERF76415.1 hypothetical protein EPUS_06973 [Endocarpon pusillum Z07020]
MIELERLYLDDAGPAGFKFAITPCTQYIDPTGPRFDQTLGRQSAAQWIRAAFHDMVTADVAAGTGGIDASIGFETHRPENFGVAFNDSLFWFSFFTNDKLSMADLIALGAAMSVGACGGPQIPLRGGRIDATGPGASGVPEPESDVKTTLTHFSGAGFNQKDAIALTACGHTMGGVHHDEFPQIVPESAVGVNNTVGRSGWDDTVANFDNSVVQQYIHGTGNKGGPLVTTTNKTVQSDLRLYSSDGNATVQKLAQSTDQFRSTCATLFTRMIDTVPKGVKLTPPIDPGSVKYSNLSLNVDWSGKMTLSGFLRYIETGGYASAPSSLTITVVDRMRRLSRTSVEATTDNTDRSNGIYGPTFHYPFTISFEGSSGLSGIEVGDQRFPLQDSLFVVPALSSVSLGRAAFQLFGPAQELTFNITAALRSSNPPRALKGTIALPVPQPGSISPKMDFSTTVQLDLIGAAGPFALYSVVHRQTMTPKQLVGTSIDVVDERGGGTAMFFKLSSLLR